MRVPDLRLVVQDLMQHGMDRRRLVFQPVLQLVDEQFAVFLLPDQPFGDFPLLRDDGSVVLDAPDREAADRPENQQQRKSRGIGQRVAEIDADAERAARNRRRDPDPEAADGGGKEHGRKIGREEHVGADLGQAPPRQRSPKQGSRPQSRC